MDPSLAEISLLVFWAGLWSLVAAVYLWATLSYVAWRDVTLRDIARGVLEFLLVDLKCGYLGLTPRDEDSVRQMDAAALRIGVALSSLGPMLLGLFSLNLLHPPIGHPEITPAGTIAIYFSMLGAHLHLRVAFRRSPAIFQILFWSSMLVPFLIWTATH